jgi:hypothetical protein
MELLSPCMQKEGTVSSGSATVRHVGTEKTDLSDESQNGEET